MAHVTGVILKKGETIYTDIEIHEKQQIFIDKRKKLKMQKSTLPVMFVCWNVNTKSMVQ